MEDEYFLAREYAGELFDARDERFNIAVSAFIAGVDVGHKGRVKSIVGDKIMRIIFFFPNDEREFKLKEPIYVLDRFQFLRELRGITGIKNVGIYD